MLNVTEQDLRSHYREVDDRIASAARRRKNQEEQERRLATEERRRRKLETYLDRQLERLIVSFCESLSSGMEEIGRQVNPEVLRIKQESVRGRTYMGRAMTISDLEGRSVRREVVEARHLAMVRCLRELSMTSSEVGAEFGGRDHSTVLHAARKVEG